MNQQKRHSAVLVMQRMSKLDDYDPRWRCCGCIRVCKGAVVIAVLGVLAALFELAIGVAFILNDTKATFGGFGLFGGSVVLFALLNVVSNVLVVVGVYRVNSNMLTLQVVLFVLNMIATALGLLALVFIGVFWRVLSDMALHGPSHELARAVLVILREFDGRIGCAALIVGCLMLIAMTFLFWFFRVIVDCRRYLRLLEMSAVAGGDCQEDEEFGLGHAKA